MRQAGPGYAELSGKYVRRSLSGAKRVTSSSLDLLRSCKAIHLELSSSSLERSSGTVGGQEPD